MSRAFFRAALEGASLPEEGVLVARAPISPTSVTSLLDAWNDGGRAGPLMVWDAPDPEPDGTRWSFLGSGEAARVDGEGAGRIAAIRAGAERLFASMVERRHPELEAVPGVRLFGGLAFRPDDARHFPWAAFPDASFVLPRWLVGTSSDWAFLQLSVRGGELADRGVIASIDRIHSVLDTAHLTKRIGPRASASGPSGGVCGPLADARGSGPLADARGSNASAADSNASAADSNASAATWEAMVESALAGIEAGAFQKVVPMTVSRIRSGAPLSLTRALIELGASYPECARFAFQRGTGTFLGASPERLVTRRGTTVESDGLAGSAPRRAGDGSEARALLESDKDRREHAVVVDAIRAALAPVCAELRIPASPVVRSHRNVHHLHTPIAGTLARPVHALDLVQALHPTPAVCGTPRDAALAWIAAHEPEPRGWYAGASGWFDAAGDGAFWVAIRSALLEEREAWLYAGAGIVRGSEAAAELEETRIKQTPVRAALGLLP